MSGRPSYLDENIVYSANTEDCGVVERICVVEIRLDELREKIEVLDVNDKCYRVVWRSG